MKIMKLNTTLYENHHTHYLMQERGIKRPNEKIEDVFRRVIVSLVHEDLQLDNTCTIDAGFLEQLLFFTNKKIIVYGTQILTHVGREEAFTAGACTVLSPTDEHGEIDFESFAEVSRRALNMGIGTGYDLSRTHFSLNLLRRISSYLYEKDHELRNKNKRPSASMITLEATHPEILRFISAKNTADFSKSRFNISVFVTEELFERAQNNESWGLINSNGKMINTISAKYLLLQIAKSAHYCGEPGILFKDRFERDNPTPQWKYISTAPCAELAMAKGDLCHFSYINLAGLVNKYSNDLVFDFASFGKAVSVLVRLLDAAVQMTINNGNDIAELSSLRRRIGVGITGFASLLIKLDIPYASKEAIRLAEKISEYLDFHAKKASMLLAKRRGAFPAFMNSKYTEPEWVKRKHCHRTGILAEEKWEELYHNIQEWGMRNASTTVFPPAGTSSQIANISTSFEPYFSLVDYRMNDSGTLIPVIPEEIYNSLKRTKKSTHEIHEIVTHILDPASKHMLSDLSIGAHFATARQIPPIYHLKMVVAFQKFADDGAAKTINMVNNTTVKEVYDMIWAAYRLGLKGFTVFRDGCLNERKW
ncbi:MAG: hypothetical protein DRQ49_01540 [Gammaproteobacteria bacterium]|nr:MAG: hypothetical protein DRQ49_01540 [Gammaproteobacteria bacterium]